MVSKAQPAVFLFSFLGESWTFFWGGIMFVVCLFLVCIFFRVFVFSVSVSMFPSLWSVFFSMSFILFQFTLFLEGGVIAFDGPVLHSSFGT